ncbi:DNA repair protein RecN [Skermania piniformis]|uniref:DNA repair protein RecN n=1 Tax=Skermania pinensis TaxID=39122 RepID=A0ABX8S5T9_9ACTN|nr:DNA repair protein RecN [Skermania piniformis]QXQ12522.1 DNA repair protein RecN [Skermania piniformis]
MLEEIRIEGLGAISTASARFDAGFTVLTGETGAGKTMVVTSLHLLGGARAASDRVRAGAKRAVVEGRFGTEDVAVELRSELDRMLDEAGAGRDDDDSVIVARTVTADGRSRAHLGGRGVPAGVLAEFTAPLLTVHGQHDQLRLQRADEQRRALDRFAGGPVADLLSQYRSVRAEWTRTRRELTERTERARELALEADRLQQSLLEIDAVAPEPGEDVALVTEVRRLSELDTLRDAATAAHLMLTGDDSGAADSGGVLDLLGTARARLDGTDDPALTELAPRLGEAIAIAVDAAGELSSYLDALPADPGALDRLLGRQAELKALVRKYAADVAGVLEWAERGRERLASLDVSVDALSRLSEQVDAAGALLARLAADLSTARHDSAAKLAEAVSGELGGLAMGGARLQVQVRPVPAAAGDAAALVVDGHTVTAGPFGIDEVEFRLAASDGGQPRPIGRTASGGELSRVMLALEVVLADSEHGATMVFDEVDAGVGGRAAVEIGRRLARLARTRQVIVVTHLPQVAAFADTHLVVDRTDRDAASVVRTLADDQRVVELARMLAGLDDTETGRAHAEELLATARAERG